MTITLKLEAIDDDFAQVVGSIVRFMREAGMRAGENHFRGVARRPWVAEITGWRGGRWYEREFLDGNKDYSQANSIGSRGVYLYYYLREGRIYEVNELSGRTRSRRYFCTVCDGAVIEMDASEVQDALSERAERQARRE